MSEQIYNCTTTSTIPVDCINPIRYFLEEAKRLSETSNNQISLFEAINRLLDNGLVVNNCGICCPDCSVLEYFLGSIETYLIKYIEQTLAAYSFFKISEIYKCCVNVSAIVEEWLKYHEVFTLNLEFPDVPPTCCNNFTKCIDDLFKYQTNQDCRFVDSIDFQRILDKGIVEQNSINGESQICFIFNILKEFTDCGCFDSIFQIIIDKGLVISCNNNRLFIGSAETYTNYIVSLIPA